MYLLRFGVLSNVSEKVTVTENVHHQLVVQEDLGLWELAIQSNLTRYPVR